MATCVQPEARSPGVSRVNTYADPLLDWVVVIERPDHHRVAVDRHAAAEVVTRSAVARGQLGNLRPAGGEVAGVSRVNTYADPLLDPLSSSPFAPITIVSPSIDTLQPK